jgi:homoserine kinase
VDENEIDPIHGDVPEGLGPEVFREQLRQAAQQDPAHGAHIKLEKETVFLEDVQAVEAEPEGGHKSRVRLRNGVIIGGLSGAAIVAALATIRYRRRKSS